MAFARRGGVVDHAVGRFAACSPSRAVVAALGRGLVCSGPSDRRQLVARRESAQFQELLLLPGQPRTQCQKPGDVLFWIAVHIIKPGDRLWHWTTQPPNVQPDVEGAAIHHNPTPGPAGQKFIYGHVWVTLSWVVRHACWGTIGLPLLAMLYVGRSTDKIAPWYKVRFQTKLEQGGLGRVGGANPSRPGKNAVDRRPTARTPNEPSATRVAGGRSRGQPAAQRRGLVERAGGSAAGETQTRPAAQLRHEAISLAKRAGHPHGWQQGEFVLYGQQVRKKYKTFLATYEPAGGLIRVLLVKGSGPLGRLLLHPGRCYRPGNSGSGGRPLGHRAEFPRSQGSARHLPAATAPTTGPTSPPIM